MPRPHVCPCASPGTSPVPLKRKRTERGRKRQKKKRAQAGEQRKSEVCVRSGIPRCKIMRVSRWLTGGEISPHYNSGEVSTWDCVNRSKTPPKNNKQKRKLISGITKQ